MISMTAHDEPTIIQLPGGPALRWPIVAVDFDGVLARYTGDYEAGPGEPMPDAQSLVDALHDEGYAVVIHSARPTSQIRTWCERHGIEVDAIWPRKVPAVGYIDDRSVRYNPSMSVGEVVRMIREPAHWEVDRHG